MNEVWRPAAEAFHAHIFGCPQCVGPVNHYCAEGWRLKEDYTAAFLASVPRSEQVRQAAIIDRDYPPDRSERIKAKARDLIWKGLGGAKVQNGQAPGRPVRGS